MNSRHQALRGLESASWALRIGLGGGMFLAGLDKFFGRLATWSMYLADWTEKLLPLSGELFLKVVGVGEMAIGLLVLSARTRLGAYLAAAWLIAIAVQLSSTGMFYDLALRDLELALAAFALGRLAEWRNGNPRPRAA